MDRLKSLPTWLRLLLVALPFLICLPLLCILVFAYQQFSSWQSATATAAYSQTQQAAVETAEAEKAQRQTSTAAAAAATETVNAQASQTALALQQQAQTQTALAIPTDTPSPIPSPTDTERPVVFFTSTPKLYTVTLRECRGDEGTVIFGAAQPQSINANKTLSFTVPPGTYTLRIIWLRKKENNVNTQVVVTNQHLTLNFGQCP